jgi:hypothetical protein
MNEINKLFDLMGIDFDTITSAMLESMIENVKEKIPDIPASFWDKYRKNLDTESLRTSYVDIYKRHYTQEEIADLVKFFESPLGRKSTKVELQIAQEFQAINAAYFESLAKEVVEEMLAEDDS